MYECTLGRMTGKPEAIGQTLSFLVADYPGTTREASDPSSIHVELGIVDLDSSELNLLP
jgi:hypothetical protein